MRIAYLAVEFPTEENFDHGAGVSMGREVRALAAFGHEVTTFCWGDRDQRLSFFGTPLYRISRHLAPWARAINKLSPRLLADLMLCRIMSYRTWKTFRELHARKPFDVIVAASSAGVSYDTARRASVPLVIRLSQYQPDWTALDGPHTLAWRLRDRFEIRALKRADAIWTKSYHMSRVLRDRTGLRAAVIEPPFCVDVHPIDDSILDEADLRDRRFFVCMGPLGLRKGSDIIARAASAVVAHCPDVLFVFVGTSKTRRSDGMGTWDWVCRYAESRVRSNMRYLGKVTRQRMFALIEHAQATVIAARTDNLPNASYETMGTGNILVASRDASFEQLVVDGVNGFLFENGNAAHLAERLLHVLYLPGAERQTVRTRARERIEVMAPARAGRRLAEFLESVATMATPVRNASYNGSHARQSMGDPADVHALASVATGRYQAGGTRTRDDLAALP